MAAECHPNPLPRKIAPVARDRQALGWPPPSSAVASHQSTPPDGWNFRIGAQGQRMGTSTRGHRGQELRGKVLPTSLSPSSGAASLPGLTLGRSEDCPQPLPGPCFPQSSQETTKRPRRGRRVNAQNHGWSVGGATQLTTHLDLGRKRPRLTRRRTALLETCYSLSDLPVWLVCRLFSTIMLRLLSVWSVY